MNQIKFIRETLDIEDLFLQLVEEALELALAGVKLIRAKRGVNPTPVTEEQARANLIEEMADVSLSLQVLGLDEPGTRFAVKQIMERKKTRWVERLGEGGENQNAT